MKRVLAVAALLTALTACGGTSPASDPIPTIGTTEPSPTASTPTTTTTTTTPPPAPPPTEVPEVAPPPVEPAPYTPPPAEPPPPAPVEAYYANCSEARAAGAAPLHRGDPGYRPALDRDDDGVACES